MAQWISSEMLGLLGTEVEDWENFCSALVALDIDLYNRSDTLFWTGGDPSGSISTRNAYVALASSLWVTIIVGVIEDFSPGNLGQR